MRFVHRPDVLLFPLLVGIHIAPAFGAEPPSPQPSAGTASAPSYSTSPSHLQRIVSAIKHNIVWPTGDAPDAVCEVDVGLDVVGTIVSTEVTRSQGHPDWCNTVLRALSRTGRIPLDEGGRAPSRLSIVFRGKE